MEEINDILHLKNFRGINILSSLFFFGEMTFVGLKSNI